MKPAPVHSSDAWLSFFDLDGDIARRAKEITDRLVSAEPAPDYLSDDGKKRFQEAQNDPTLPSILTGWKSIQTRIGCVNAAFLILLPFSFCKLFCVVGLGRFSLFRSVFLLPAVFYKPCCRFGATV